MDGSGRPSVDALGLYLFTILPFLVGPDKSTRQKELFPNQ